jgi:signal peptidase I
MTAVLVGFATPLLFAVAVALLRRRLVVVSVNGPSMAPTLRHGDVVVVRRTPGRTPNRGEVVVVEDARPCRPGDRTGAHSRMWMVKRVAAIPGDPAPPFLPAWTRSPTGLVPAGHVVLIGDNAELSRDSRLFGPVRTDRVVGVVVRPVTDRLTALGYATETQQPLS